MYVWRGRAAELDDIIGQGVQLTGIPMAWTWLPEEPFLPPQHSERCKTQIRLYKAPYGWQK